ncbi:MAG: TonB-dependent receptor, partial [Proteobacteria bacterium]|nr:TonB-dependent receptor [Pseudomonadota bacterium]
TAIERLRAILLCRFFLCLTANLCLVPMLAQAQTTSASLRGTVLDNQGKPVENASIQLESKNNQVQKSSLSNAQGEFAFHGLRVGGPYTVTATKTDSSPAKREGLILKAGSNDSIVLNLGAPEVMKVTGAKTVAVSQIRVFGAGDIQKAPSASGDPKDLVRMSSDSYVDGQSLSIVGANNRFNSITIDVIRQDDDFGLNGNGYPTQRSPISLQSVAEITVERSPFDVRYGNFLGGNVNVVSKSGSNEFEGSVTTSYTGNKLTGNRSKDLKYNNESEEKHLGLTLSGPIIEDKLTYFLSVDALKASTPNTVGPKGSGQATEVSKVSQDDVARAQDITSSVYGFNAGTSGQTLDEDDLKLLAKIDWTINDQHRLEAKYQQSRGNSTNNGQPSDKNLPLTSSWYKRQDNLNTLSLRLFSDWSHDLSTKFELSHKEVSTEFSSLEGNNFMAAEITTADKGTIQLGPDRFHHTNELKNTSVHVGAEANYLVTDHQITSGLEQDKVSIYNLFVPSSKGFAEYASLDDFAAKKPSLLTYNNAISQNPRDAAANWEYAVNALYIQDELQLTPQWTTRFGLRSEFYDASQTISANENFMNRYGYDNTATVAGKQVLLPRLGASYKASKTLSIRSGVGLYSGGTPNVWLSNSYTNNGVSTDSASSSNAEGFDGRTIPDSLKNSLQAGDGNVDALDPNFNIPQTWKFSVGSNYRFDIPFVTDNVLLDFDYTYSRVRYGVLWKDLRRNLASISNNQPTTIGPDGRALYDTDTTSAAASDFNTQRGYDLLLTNTDQGFGHTASLSLSKNFSSGFDVSLAYGWQRIFDVNPGTSSTSVSNYSQLAIARDPNDPELARSNYERQHRFLISTGYTKNFLETLATSFNLFFERRSGQPYSYTFGGKADSLGGLFGESRDFSGRGRMLFYVPKGDGSDVILDGIDEGQFNEFLRKSGLDRYRGKIAPRNAFTSDWMDQIDARLTQELPSFSSKNRARLVLDIKNLPNFVNKRWGQVKQAPFPYFSRAVDVSYDSATGRYRYSKLNDADPQVVRVAESVWKMQLALVYEF